MHRLQDRIRSARGNRDRVFRALWHIQPFVKLFDLLQESFGIGRGEGVCVDADEILRRSNVIGDLLAVHVQHLQRQAPRAGDVVGQHVAGIRRKPQDDRIGTNFGEQTLP